jgi:hypothetical protein
MAVREERIPQPARPRNRGSRSLGAGRWSRLGTLRTERGEQEPDLRVDVGVV